MSDSTTTRRGATGRARPEASRTASSPRLSMTPRPWLPSSGLSATGKPILPAAAAAPRRRAHTSARGTGTPVAARSWLVSFLSDAMSTAIELVLQVMVARMRCWWTPWPSWTSEAGHSGGSTGCRAAPASSSSACVDGPKAARSASRTSARTRRAKSKSVLGSTRWLTSRTASLPGGDADGLLGDE